jgi:tetratricopeptide (TPR) repeat protein
LPQTPASSPAAAKPGAAASTRSETAELTRRAEKARAAGKLDEAVALYRQALRRKPGWAEAEWGLGTILYDLDQYADARDAFARFVAGRPKDGPAHAMKGLCEFQLRAYDQSLTDLQHARLLGLGKNEQLASVVGYHVGILLTRSGQFELAYEALREFALRGVDHPYLVEALGLSMLRMPYLPADAPVQEREMILLAGRGALMMADGRHNAAARASFEDLVRRFPDAANAHYAFGTYLVPQEPDVALEEFERVLRLDPDHVPALLQIAFEQIKRGRFDAALPFAEKAVRVMPGFFAAQNALGRALLELGEVDRAVAALETGTRLAPDSPDMYFALARAYQKAGRTQDAERARATFVELDKARSARRAPKPEAEKPPEG